MIPRLAVAWLSGLVFALGLGLSEMTNPNKVIAFLDVAGAWDPSLALVMVGAIGTYAVPAWWIQRRGQPFLDGRFHWSDFAKVDRRLLIGATVFGVGWGLGGYCPGPAVVAGAVGSAPALWFCVGMVGGMLAYHQLAEWWARASAREADAAG